MAKLEIFNNSEHKISGVSLSNETGLQEASVTIYIEKGEELSFVVRHGPAGHDFFELKKNEDDNNV